MRKDKITTGALRARKGADKIVAVTAYDFTMASLLDAAEVDVLMVGDSLGMVVQGREDTLAVTLDEMSYHCRAVARARPRAHVVCDLPFLSYHVSDEQALASAGRLLKEAGAEGVKLEGGRVMAARVARIVEAGIPVMGHIGLTPQAVHQMGGFRVQGRTSDGARSLIDDARSLADAGVYALVVEGVPTEVGCAVTEAIDVPTIGIGAGPGTDGQVLVCYDLLGMYRGLSPKFVKKYRSLGDEIVAAAANYREEVRLGQFPTKEHGFVMADGEHVPELSYRREEAE